MFQVERKQTEAASDSVPVAVPRAVWPETKGNTRVQGPMVMPRSLSFIFMAEPLKVYHVIVYSENNVWVLK